MLEALDDFNDLVSAAVPGFDGLQRQSRAASANATMLGSSDPRLQAALDFSRNLYNLAEPDEAHTENDTGLNTHTHSQSVQLADAGVVAGIACTEAVAREMLGVARGRDVPFGRVVLERLATPTDDHRCQAILDVLDNVRYPHTAPPPMFNAAAPAVQALWTGSSLLARLDWNDVEFATKYQTLCAKLLRSLTLCATATTQIIGGAAELRLMDAPSRLYDGPTYHQCLQLRKKHRSHIVARVAALQADTARWFGEVARVRQRLSHVHARMALANSRALLKSLPKLGAAGIAGGFGQYDGLSRMLYDPVRTWDLKGASANATEPRAGLAHVSRGELPSAQAPATPKSLPIAAHAKVITDHIANHRVTIIIGETGCGKSSQVPAMVFRSCPNARVFVSQPRRIAATTLMQRVRGELGDVVGLRLGHGIRDEKKKTRIWFCSAGYLKEFLAHNEEAVARITHIIIDEVHERSIDTDLLCFFVRRLLSKYQHLKVVLMSATAAADTYKQYFSIPEEPLFVGARRFPLSFKHLGDLTDGVTLPKPIIKLLNNLSSSHWDSKAPSASKAKAQHNAAFHLARAVGVPGRSVLIFVSGIADIEAITLKFEELQGQTNRTYEIYAIHSDIPFESQMEAFSVTGSSVKIVVATNAAESSITLPDCDNVICCGTEKAIEYDPLRHRVSLAAKWISKASAVQRAGRTGRTGPGTVWRLYPLEIYDAMDEYQAPEILASPLDQVILQLKTSFDIPVSSILADVMDPPSVDAINASLDALSALNFLTSASDDAEVTDEGSVAATLGTDLSIAKFIIYGIRLGVLREAVCVAAALAQQHTCFVRASHFVHETTEMYDLLGKTIAGQDFFDGGLMSKPLLHIRILDWFRSKKRSRDACYQRGLVHQRVSQLDQKARHLEATVRRALRGHNARSVTSPPADFGKPYGELLCRSATVNALRLAIFWALGTKNTVTTATTTETIFGATSSKVKLSVDKEGISAGAEPLKVPGEETQQIPAVTVDVRVEETELHREQVEAVLPAGTHFQLISAGLQTFQLKGASCNSLLEMCEAFQGSDNLSAIPMKWAVSSFEGGPGYLLVRLKDQTNNVQSSAASGSISSASSGGMATVVELASIPAKYFDASSLEIIEAFDGGWVVRLSLFADRFSRKARRRLQKELIKLAKSTNGSYSSFVLGKDGKCEAELAGVRVDETWLKAAFPGVRVQCNAGKGQHQNIQFPLDNAEPEGVLHHKVVDDDAAITAALLCS